METSLDGVKRLQPKRFGDERGWFAELWSTASFAKAGLPTNFVQDNQSLSRRGVLRGLHFQVGHPQGKLIRVLQGEIWDVAVDVRRDSPTFGKWEGFRLRPVNEEGELEVLWIPEGFAHGFLVLSEVAEVLYKVTDVYFPAGERTLRWDDPELKIDWPLHELAGASPIVSDKDMHGAGLRDVDMG